MSAPRCPVCGALLFLETLDCGACGTALGFHPPSIAFVALPVGDGSVRVDGVRWRRCANRAGNCNWLAPVAPVGEASDADEAGEAGGRCLSCRLTRRRPDAGDTAARSALARVAVDKRRLLIQVMELGLPITPHYERPGGLAFDLVSSHSGQRVTIGHANGVITIDLAESQGDYREQLRVRLGEPYRTMLGHFRHEIGHYYQRILLGRAGDGPASEALWEECRTLFGDERASYKDARKRHYSEGAPEGWTSSYISDYATMHPWEDFAETFAHYLHITGTLSTAADAGLVLDSDRAGGIVVADIVPRRSYRDHTAAELLRDWRWLSLMFNRVNRAMGQGDLYPFGIAPAVAEKLAFVHRIVGAGPVGSALTGSVVGLPAAAQPRGANEMAPSGVIESAKVTE